jgi:endogenous inhibitor of DNA gyrase (YacG/DUF329 family)
MVTLKCKRCGKEIITYEWLKNRKKYCSKKCQKVIKIKKQCIICNKIFEVYKYRENTAKFCSDKCHRKYNKGKKAVWYGKHHSEKTKEKISKANKGKKCSEEQRKKMSKIQKNRKHLPCYESTKIKIGLANKGKNNGQWKGGITPLRVTIWQNIKSKEWRLSVYERDKFTCQMPNCDRTETFLNAHHIKEFSKILEEYNIKTIEDAIDCEKLWDINNGITLCKKCHGLTKMREEQYASLFQEIVKLNSII